MKYRKKPIVIEAEIYHKGLEDGWEYEDELPEKMDALTFKKMIAVSKVNGVRLYPYINTLEGKMFICEGDWIITGVNGERYPCKPDIFEKTYELVKENPEDLIVDYNPCPRCKCCEMFWQECWQCAGEGFSHHDCGEDCCMCLYPENNVVCDICNGEGGWYYCTCDEQGKHKEKEYLIRAEMTKLREILEKHIVKVGKYYEKYRQFYIDELETDLKEAIRGVLPEFKSLDLQRYGKGFNECYNITEEKIKDLIGE